MGIMQWTSNPTPYRAAPCTKPAPWQAARICPQASWAAAVAMDAAMGAAIAKTSKPILPSGIRILRIVLVPKVFVPKVDKPVAAPRHTDRLAFPAYFLRINRVDIVDCPRTIRLNHTRGRGTQLDTPVRQTDRDTVASLGRLQRKRRGFRGPRPVSRFRFRATRYILRA
jgi:hypothetical protein